MVLEFVQVSATTMETEMTSVQCTELKKIELRRSDDVIQSNESQNSRNFGNSQNRSWRVMGHTAIDEESNGELE